jgi:protoporphyrin/coproporphyrin ferrochelatase
MGGEPFAVLLMAYGGPERLEDVAPYLLDIRGGRPTSLELVEEVRARYAAIGGRSPLRELTEAQARGVAAALGVPAYVGMRHWHPYISEAVRRMTADGRRRAVAIAMAPHYSAMSVGAYQKQLLAAAGSTLDLALVRSWGEEPRYLDAVQESLTQTLQRFPSPPDVHVIFTAHSLPRRIVADGDPYVMELERSAAALARRLQLAHWELAWQSAGRSPEPWLGPDAAEVLERLAGEGKRDVLIAPIGFVCDHVEVLYDVDIAYQAVARRLGLRLERPRSLNDDPGLIAALADVVRRAARERGWLP